MAYLIVLGIVLIVAVCVLLIVILKKQSKKKKLLAYFEKEYLNILRIDALNRSIVSPYDQNIVKTGPQKLLVQVNEKSELTDKTYLLDMKTPWVIGRKPGENAICIRGDKTVSALHCMLKQQNGILFLVDMGSKNSVLYKPSGTRGYYLPKKGAQALTSGDVFCVGFTSFKVTIFDSKRGII